MKMTSFSIPFSFTLDRLEELSFIPLSPKQNLPQNNSFFSGNGRKNYIEDSIILGNEKARLLQCHICLTFLLESQREGHICKDIPPSQYSFVSPERKEEFPNIHIEMSPSRNLARQQLQSRKVTYLEQRSEKKLVEMFKDVKTSSPKSNLFRTSPESPSIVQKNPKISFPSSESLDKISQILLSNTQMSKSGRGRVNRFQIPPTDFVHQFISGKGALSKRKRKNVPSRTEKKSKPSKKCYSTPRNTERISDDSSLSNYKSYCFRDSETKIIRFQSPLTLVQGKSNNSLMRRNSQHHASLESTIKDESIEAWTEQPDNLDKYIIEPDSEDLCKAHLWEKSPKRITSRQALMLSPNETDYNPKEMINEHNHTFVQDEEWLKSRELLNDNNSDTRFIRTLTHSKSSPSIKIKPLQSPRISSKLPKQLQSTMSTHPIIELITPMNNKKPSPISIGQSQTRRKKDPLESTTMQTIEKQRVKGLTIYIQNIRKERSEISAKIQEKRLQEQKRNFVRRHLLSRNLFST